MNRLFRFVSFLARWQPSSACRDDRRKAGAGQPEVRARVMLNRVALVSVLALCGHVALADDAATLPPLPPLADPPTHVQLPGKFVWADLFVEDDEQARSFIRNYLAGHGARSAVASTLTTWQKMTAFRLPASYAGTARKARSLVRSGSPTSRSPMLRPRPGK